MHSLSWAGLSRIWFTDPISPAQCGVNGTQGPDAENATPEHPLWQQEGGIQKEVGHGSSHVPCIPCTLSVLQCLLEMSQVEYALGTAESTAMARNSGKSWGICSKRCNTLCVALNLYGGCCLRV